MTTKVQLISPVNGRVYVERQCADAAQIDQGFLGDPGKRVLAAEGGNTAHRENADDGGGHQPAPGDRHQSLERPEIGVGLRAALRAV